MTALSSIDGGFSLLLQFHGIIPFQNWAKHCAFPSFLEMDIILWLKLSRELQPKADIWRGVFLFFSQTINSLTKLLAELPVP